MNTAAEPAYASVEAETRRNRPPTDTLGLAIREFLGQSGPDLILDLTALSALGRVALGRFKLRELLFPVGVAAAWPIAEWAAHRWILHIKPFRILGREIDPFFAKAHRTHHANPSDFDWVQLPTSVVRGAYAGFAVLLAAATRNPRVVLAGMTSVSAAALVYEWVHWMAHTDYTPRSRWLKQVVRRHRLHHYRSEKHWYAFTVPEVDDWFGTGGAPRDVEASGTVRDLGVGRQSESGASDR